MVLRGLTMLCALLLLLMRAPGALADTDADWQAGQDAFASGDLASALVFFTSARDQGLSGPAVRYNIAVCQYELGDYAAARDTFRSIATRYPRMRGLAEYNVGLAERRLGNPIAAQQQFIAAWHSSDDPKVRALAVSQLTELERAQPQERLGLIIFGVGHDDNVALRDRLGLPAGVSGESPFADLFAALHMPFARTSGLAIDGGFYAVSYPDADEYDQAELRAGVRYTSDAVNWQFDSGFYLVTGTLDGSRFNEELNTDIRATRFFSDAASIEMRLRYDEIRGTETRFDGIDGSRSSVDIRYRWRRLPHYLVLRGGIEENDRRDAGISPARRRVQASYYHQLTDQWEIEAAASFGNSRYDSTAGSRDEELATIVLGANFDLGGDWALSLRYQYSENNSTDPVFSYRRNQLTFGARYLFQP